MSPRYLFFLIESSLGLDIYDWGNFLIRMKWPIPSGKNFPRRMVKFAVRAINTVKRVRNWKGSKKHCLRILKFTFHWEVFVLVSWLWRHWHWFRLSVTVCRFCIWNWLLGWIIHDFYILVVQRWGRVQSLSDCYLRWMPVQSHYHIHLELIDFDQLKVSVNWILLRGVMGEQHVSPKTERKCCWWWWWCILFDEHNHF